MQSVNRTKCTLAQLIIFIVINYLTNLATADELPVRNSFDSKTHIESQHFAYWYNDTDKDIDTNHLYQQLEILEKSRQSLVLNHGFRDSIKDFKTNIYMENTGGSTPSDHLTGAFVADDPDGYLFIHMVKETLTYDEGKISALRAHELFHTVQFEYFIYGQVAAMDHDYYWFQEGSASWASYLVWQDASLLTHWGVWALDLKPELSLTHSEFSTSHEEITQHMYGSSLFIGLRLIALVIPS